MLRLLFLGAATVVLAVCGVAIGVVGAETAGAVSWADPGRFLAAAFGRELGRGLGLLTARSDPAPAPALDVAGEASSPAPFPGEEGGPASGEPSADAATWRQAPPVPAPGGEASEGPMGFLALRIETLPDGTLAIEVEGAPSGEEDAESPDETGPAWGTSPGEAGPEPEPDLLPPLPDLPVPPARRCRVVPAKAPAPDSRPWIGPDTGYSREPRPYARMRSLGEPVQTAVAVPAHLATDASARDLSYRYDLRSVSMRGGDKLGNAGAKALGWLWKLRHLDLAGANGVGNEGAHALTWLGKLRSLSLGGVGGESPIDDSGLRAVHHLGDLQDLSLVNTGIGDETLGRIGTMRRLRTVRLDGSRAITDRGLRAFQGHPRLARLSLRGCPIGDGALGYVAGARGLRELDLSGTRVSGPGLRWLGDQPNLRRVDLSGTPIDDSALWALSGAKGVRSLDLSGTAVSERGIGELEAMPNLRTLDLRGCTGITDRDWRTLARIETLRELWLDESFDARSAAEIRRWNPRCTVYRGGTRV